MIERRTADEIYIEGVGEVRRLTERQQYKAFRRDRKNGMKRAWAFACGRTLAEFNRLSPEQQAAVGRAYRALTDDRARMSPSATETAPAKAEPWPRFQKGIHRSDEEKIRIGLILIGVKQRVPRGTFGPRLDEMEIPRSFAQACMQLARKATGDSEDVSSVYCSAVLSSP